MGEVAAKLHEQPSGSAENQTGEKGKGTGGQKGQNTGSKGSSDHTATGGQETTRGTTEIRILQPSAQEERVSGLAPVIPEPPKQGKRKAPEAPKGSKSSPSSTKAQAAAVAEAATAQTAAMIAALIKTISDVCTLRPGMEVWRFSEAECRAIAEPTANIMAKHNLTEKTGEYADYIALIVALGVAIVPRVMMQASITPKKQVEVKNNVQPIQPKPQQPAAAKPEASPGNGNRQQNDGGASSYGNSPIKQLLTPIMG